MSRARIVEVVAAVAVSALIGIGIWWFGPRESPEEKEEAQQEAQQQAYEECKALTEEALSLLNELNSKLEVGILERDHFQLTQDAQVEIDSIDYSTAVPECEDYVGAAMEDAVFEYAQASEHWQETYFGLNRKLNEHWLPAENDIREAEDGLEAIRTGDVVIDPDAAEAGTTAS